MAKSKVDYWLTEDGLTLLRAWTRDGLIDNEIAKKMKIVRSTLALWKNKYEEISDALKKGKEVVDIEVENSLLKNAKGFHYIEEVVTSKKEVIYKDGKRVREVSEPVVVEIHRYKPPETLAQIYWLKNRRPDIWRDKPPEKEIPKESVTIVDDLPKTE